MGTGGADSSPPSSELFGELDGPGEALVEAAVHGGGNARCTGDEGRFLVGEVDDAEADRAMAKEARGFLLEAVAERGVEGDDVAHDVAVEVGAAVELFRDVVGRAEQGVVGGGDRGGVGVAAGVVGAEAGGPVALAPVEGGRAAPAGGAIGGEALDEGRGRAGDVAQLVSADHVQWRLMASHVLPV